MKYRPGNVIYGHEVFDILMKGNVYITDQQCMKTFLSSCCGFFCSSFSSKSGNFLIAVFVSLCFQLCCFKQFSMDSFDMHSTLNVSVQFFTNWMKPNFQWWWEKKAESESRGSDAVFQMKTLQPKTIWKFQFFLRAQPRSFCTNHMDSPLHNRWFFLFFRNFCGFAKKAHGYIFTLSTIFWFFLHEFSHKIWFLWW